MQATPEPAQPAPPPAPAAPALPAPAIAPASPGSPVGRAIVTGADVPGGAPAYYQALRNQRQELGNQLERLQDERNELAQRLHEGGREPADQKGLEARLSDLDARISSVDKMIAESDAAVAQAAGIPGAIVPDPPPEPERGPPDSVVAITIIFIVLVLFPLAFAHARRLWKRPAVGPMTVPPELNDRLGRLEQAMETVAVEVERIGEGQRFVTKLFAEPGARPIAAGTPAAAQPEVRATEPIRQASRG